MGDNKRAFASERGSYKNSNMASCLSPFCVATLSLLNCCCHPEDRVEGLIGTLATCGVVGMDTCACTTLKMAEFAKRCSSSFCCNIIPRQVSALPIVKFPVLTKSQVSDQSQDHCITGASITPVGILVGVQDKLVEKGPSQII
jgi:hypothetical protein